MISLKKIILTFIFVYLINIIVLFSQNYLIKAYVEWDKLDIAWKSYISNPNEKNALVVYDLLPSKGHVRKENSNKIVEQLIQSNISILEEQILEGNANSLKVVFRLFTISGGAFSEELQIIIGELIKINPYLFLKELKIHSHLVDLEKLLCNCGPKYWRDIDVYNQELIERKQAITTVDDPKLVEIKDKSINLLNANIEHLKTIK